MHTKKLFVLNAILAFSLLAAPASAGAQEYVQGFIFGSRNLSCSVEGAPGETYTMVHHSSPGAIAYDAGRGWGYEVLVPGDGSRGGYGQFGPFDDSPNGRAAFADNSCPTEIYDSFIGAKNFVSQCDEFIVGDRETACSEVGLQPDGIIFRMDVPNGLYRFVGAFGSADNRHVSRILVENGGEGPPSLVSDDHVVLVNNFDQAEHCPGTFARVGFGCKLPPTGNGPQFIDMDEDGYLSNAGPASPLLEVTEGYIRMHQLQGNANPGACGARDPNGGNAVLLELWQVADEVGGGFLVGLDRSFNPSPYSPGQTVTVSLAVSNVLGATTVAETIPEGWTVVEPGGGDVAGNTITFAIDADGVSEYTARSPGGQCGAGEFTAVITPEGGCESSSSSVAACDPVDCGLRSSGGPSKMLQIGPISLGANAGPACDDSGRLGTTDYLSDGDITESNLLLEEGDEVLPDFGGEAGGFGVALAVNANINPGGFDGVLNVWSADTDANGYIDYNLPQNIGNPLDDYIIYSLTYLENTTDECLDTILEVGSDDGVKVLLNGSMIYLNAVCRGVPAYGGGDMVPATLVPGANVVLIAVVERGGGTGVRLAVRDTAGLPLVDGRVLASCTPPADFAGAPLSVERTIDAPSPSEPGSEINVVLTVGGIAGPATVVETFPAGLEMIDDGGGQVEGNTITFTPEVDGELVYVVALPAGECPFDSAEFSGSIGAEGICDSVVRGDTRLGCVQPPCDANPDAPEAELVAAFVFGVQFDQCTSPNDEGFEYATVAHSSADAVAYEEIRGWGYDEIDPGNLGRAGYARFGPFDDSPNDRNRFVGACPELVYDSFIGAKDFASPCNEQTVGDPDLPCVEAGIQPSGLVFRIDLPNGLYRFVAAVGDADNPHAHTLVVEDGGEGPSNTLGNNNYAFLIQNFDQNQQTTGQIKPDCLGCGVFGRVGFDDKVPPLGDGLAPDPQFVNFDVDGAATSGCPDSPVLEVTEGYIRLHQLQGNANVGPGSKNNGTLVDVNGGDLVMLEVWRIDDGGVVPPLPVPELALSVETLNSQVPGGEQAGAQAFEVWNSGRGELEYSITDDADWLRVSPPGGTSSNAARTTHQVDFDTAGLAAGVYNAVITVSDTDASNDPQTIAVTLEVLAVEPPGVVFRRGDVDANGSMQLTDGVFTLLYLFSGGGEPPCLEAADADDNGALQLTDAVFVLLFLFSGGDAPVAPGPFECGGDTGAVDLGCGEYDTCGN